ncbi:type II toxin-antitoxin system HicB family antitoxin [Mesorhizobium sp.]|uniref:type II toxin-antitoxin system HicB family antitoxin n=2 Tax=Mesorhizobium sp. TaxID=1871066 RepID=UPI00257CC706|nr:type II toxin-antitoxin system HicB family antitoxin [Mesorhizobium sp.]
MALARNSEQLGQCNQKAVGIEVMAGYRINVEPDDNGTLLITCPQLPIVVTFAEDEQGVRQHAVDAIETALASMIDDGEDVPRPDGQPGLVIDLPALTWLKLNLYWSLRDADITRAELARRLDWKRESVDRLFRLDHRSRLEQLEAAFSALGRTVEVDIRVAA